MAFWARARSPLKTVGEVTNSGGVLGSDASGIGTVTVAGAGSNWANSGNLVVGEGGAGELTIEDGGTVTDLAGFVGNLPGSRGTVTVTGPDSKWSHSGALAVGASGTGELTISNGGRVTGISGALSEGPKVQMVR